MAMSTEVTEGTAAGNPQNGKSNGAGAIQITKQKIQHLRIAGELRMPQGTSQKAKDGEAREARARRPMLSNEHSREDRL